MAEVKIYFDADGMAQELIQALIQETDVCIKEFMNKAQEKLSAEAKSATEIEQAQYDGAQYIKATAKFYADAILESFGVGSLSDTSEMSYWSEYSQSNRFNSARPGKEIVGRPRGSYVDPWGKQHSTWGKYEGVPLEGMSFTDEFGTEVKIEPKAPTYSIQNAERKSGFSKNKTAISSETWIERRLAVAAQRWFVENANRFIHN